MSTHTQNVRGRNDITRRPLAETPVPGLKQATTSITGTMAAPKSKAAGSLVQSKLSALPADVSKVLEHFSTLDQQIYDPARLQNSLNTLKTMQVSLVPLFDRMADSDREDHDDDTPGMESTITDQIDSISAKLQNRDQLINEIDLDTATLGELFMNKANVTRVEQSMARVWNELNTSFLEMMQLIDANGNASSANKENIAPISDYTQGSLE